MENVNCIICGLDNTQKLLIKNSYNIVKCKNCGLVYVNPRPTKEELVRLYSSDNNKLWDLDGYMHNSKIEKFKNGLEIIHKFTQSRGKILDIGCSTGLFLNMAKKSGWETYGIDINEKAIEYAKTKYNLNVKAQDLETSNFPSNYFDVVTLFDSIEHMPNPLFALREAYRILKPNGLLLITTPNIDGLFPKITYYLFAKTIGAWEHPTPPGHLYQFSQKTISKLLDRAKFNIIYFKSFEIPRHYTVGKLENAIIDAFKQRLKFSKGLVNKTNNKNQEKIHAYGNQSSIMKQIKKLPRISIRVMSWMLVFFIYPIANFLEKGDSMLLIAKKKQKL